MSMSAYFRSASNTREGVFARFSDLFLVAGVVAIVALLVLPLPLWLIDFLVAVNIASGLVLLLIAIYIGNAIEFSVRGRIPNIAVRQFEEATYAAVERYRRSFGVDTTRAVNVHIALI